MISHSHKLIFIHIPRTGGTSIEAELGVSISRDDKHKPASLIYQELGEQRWKEYFKFTFVRNPWDRMVSIYHQPFYNIQRNGQYFIGYKTGKGFKYFLENFHVVPWEYGADTYLDYLSVDRSKEPDIDFVGRYENRALDLRRIEAATGIKIPDKVHLRRTEHAHYLDYYDDVTRAIVEKRFEKDILYFGYKFGM